MSVGSNEESKEMLYTPPHVYPTEPYACIDAEDVNCPYTVFNGESIGCRISEDGFTCNDFNNPDEPCMFRQWLYYKNMVKKKEEQLEYLCNILDLCKNIINHELRLNSDCEHTLKYWWNKYGK